MEKVSIPFDIATSAYVRHKITTSLSTVFNRKSVHSFCLRFTAWETILALVYISFWQTASLLLIMESRVLARPYLMMLYAIFPIHVNFPITSSCVLEATIHRKITVNCFMLLEKKIFFKKRPFYDIAHACCIWLIFSFYHNLFLFFMFLYLTFINYFRLIMFYTPRFFSIFVRDSSFSSFPLIFWISGTTYCFLIKQKYG